jgi:uncharacterized membrane protein YqaE (UPF0057 family)
MEKQHYSSGYHFEWNNKNKNSEVTKNDNSTSSNSVVAVNQGNSSSVAVINESVKSVNTIAPVAVQQSTVVPVASGFHAVAKSVATTLTATKAAQTISKPAAILKQGVKAEKKSTSGKPDKTLLYVLCILIPWLAVGLATDWDVKKVIINLLWSLTCIGGIIHAFIVVSKS